MRLGWHSIASIDAPAIVAASGWARQKRAFHNHFKTILGATSHHCLIALRIRYGSIIHNSCACLADAPRWPADQSMLYKETAARRDQTISRQKHLSNSRE